MLEMEEETEVVDNNWLLAIRSTRCGETQPGLGGRRGGHVMLLPAVYRAGRAVRDFDPAGPPSDNDRQCGLSWRPRVSIADIVELFATMV